MRVHALLSDDDSFAKLPDQSFLSSHHYFPDHAGNSFSGNKETIKEAPYFLEVLFFKISKREVRLI